MMKYNIGDIVLFNQYLIGESTIYHTRVGIITDLPSQIRNPMYYEVIVSGMGERKYFVYERDIKQKL